MRSRTRIRVNEPLQSTATAAKLTPRGLLSFLGTILCFSTMLQLDLTGKIAVVTGASGDLGRVIALTLAQCGADVAVHYLRNASAAESVATKVREMGRRAVTVQAEIDDRDAVFAMRDAVTAPLGAPNIIVNNAVQQYRWTNILDQDEADFESQYRSCVLQNVLMAKAFVPAMCAAGWGRVIAINTECALQCLPSQGAYVSGKKGMDGLLRVLAREVGPRGVTVNQVAPGWMISERDRAAGTEVQPEYNKKVPLGHRGTDQDIANAVAFFASDLAGFITGTFLPVSGGSVMPGI